MNFNPFRLKKRKNSFPGVALCVCLMASQGASAQLRDYLNLPDHDTKPYYLGIGFMFTSSHLQVTAHPQFLQSDSVLYVNPMNSIGFGVSGMATLRVSPHVELRLAAPEFLFSSNQIAYHI